MPPEQKPTIGTIELINQFGMKVHLNISDMSDAYAKMREHGAQGWMSGEIPEGGFQLPYDMADVFDWSLIGAREYTTPDGDRVVYHRGHKYTRRAMPAVDTKKMKLPEAVKYSRGAKPTDPPHIREKLGEIEYVTLAIFRGKGRQIDDFVKPASKAQAA